MATDNKGLTGGGQRPPGFDPESPGGNARREPGFGGFDDRDLDEYEEPDRDTGFPAGFGADDMADEEEFDDHGRPLFTDPRATTVTLAESAAWSEGKSGDDPEEAPDEEPEDWSGDDEYYDGDDDADAGWPVRMIAVAVVAVVLLAAGVYGVLQERAATQAELTELRATLATSANPTEVRAVRDALQELQQSHSALVAEAEALTRENRELQETIAGLEAQLQAAEAPEATAQPPAAQAAAAASSEAGAPASVSLPSAAPSAGKPRAARDPAGDANGRWFVNFGSYTSRKLAEDWASRLRPASGEVIVAPGTKDNKTYYRVRVVGLSDKSGADQVARQLETEMQVSRLWVGQE